MISKFDDCQNGCGVDGIGRSSGSYSCQPAHPLISKLLLHGFSDVSNDLFLAGLVCRRGDEHRR